MLAQSTPRPFIVQVHGIVHPFVCEQCDFSAPRIGELKAHMRVHAAPATFTCDGCAYTSNKRKLLASHMRVHDDRKPYACMVCDFSSKRPGGLQKHELTHEARPCTQPGCGYVALTPEQMGTNAFQL